MPSFRRPRRRHKHRVLYHLGTSFVVMMRRRRAKGSPHKILLLKTFFPEKKEKYSKNVSTYSYGSLQDETTGKKYLQRFSNYFFHNDTSSQHTTYILIIRNAVQPRVRVLRTDVLVLFLYSYCTVVLMWRSTYRTTQSQ